MIRLDNVGRKFHNQYKIGEFWALKNIYMTVSKGEIVGIIGRNGSGKTTLLNIIAGVLPVSEGEIIIHGRVSALLALGAGFQDEFTGKDNIYLNATLLGLKKHEIDKYYNNILEFSELGDFIDASLGTYSAGMKMRLGFSVAIHKDFDILVLDEIITVGDIYFQKKCFEKIANFKRQGKTMLIAAQDMGIIERFCDKAFLLEDGQIIFGGISSEAVERYNMLLAKKKVLSSSSRLCVVRETKRWATDVEEWGKKEGTKEIVIKNVIIFNRWGLKTHKIKYGERITIRADFIANEKIDNVHFGVAIFREDGVYCYGPNTKFDGLTIEQIGRGNGYFELRYKELLLMPGVYHISVAIWDKNETFAYDYHRCYYKIEVVGTSIFGQLLRLPCAWDSRRALLYSRIDNGAKSSPNVDYLSDKWQTELQSDLISIDSVKCFDIYGNEDSVFVTGKEIKIKIDFKVDSLLTKSSLLWVGIYRSDGIYCHGSVKKSAYNGSMNSEILIYPALNLLPGGYRISAGVWDSNMQKFLAYSHGIYAFNMISDKQDHGTVYMEHRWKLRMPKGGML